MKTIYTIGHSTHSSKKFIELLLKHSITAVCDVRSSPYSQFNPQFNKETIQRELKSHGILYVFLGKELGPRSEDPECYVKDKVQYQKIAQTDIFREGIKRIKHGMESYRIALMCSEKDPIVCHRMILVCRELRSNDLHILHIIEDGTLEKNQDSEKRLMEMLHIPLVDLFDSEEDLIQRAYHQQSEKIAYIKQSPQS